MTALLTIYLALYCGALDWLPLQRRGFVPGELDVVSESRLLHSWIDLPRTWVTRHCLLVLLHRAAARRH